MKHSSASAPPVVTAILGMCPSVLVRGRRVRFASVSGVSAHAATVGIVTSRRHLPTWNTIGTFTPGGIPASVNFPWVSDRAMAAGAPDGWPQRSHVMPSAIGVSAVVGA